MTEHERDDAFETASEVLQRTTRFLTDCVKYADSALESEQVRDLIGALRQISDDAKGMAGLPEDAEEQLTRIRTLRPKKSA